MTAIKKDKNSKLAKLIGPIDPKVDAQARERLITSRVGLLMRHSFFGNLATRLRLVNADEWCATAATDGLTLYYNSRFVMMLKVKEVEFLLAHEVLHVVYDHMGRRNNRDPQLWNIADDYVVNADLKRHRIGTFITTVPCLYESKYDGLPAEEVYDDLMKNAQKINMSALLDQMIDDHLEQNDGSGDGSEDDSKPGPAKLSKEERDQLKQEIQQAILAAAEGAEAGSIPKGVERLIKQVTEPQMPWRELLQTNLTSSIRTDYSWSRPNRKSWHIEAIMPGMTPGEEIDVSVAIDMSGSISDSIASMFLGEVAGMMDSFAGYKLHVFCFDTKVYNSQEFTSENLDTIDQYEPKGGGGTDFDCMFDYLKEEAIVPKRLVVFTDMLPYGSWGDSMYCDTTWIGHGKHCKDITPPFGTWALFDD